MTLKRAKQLLLWICFSFLTAYLSLITYAHPSPALLAALCVEVVFFVFTLVYRKLNSKRKSEQMKKLVIDFLVETTKPISLLRKFIDSATVIVLSLIISLLSLDLSGLCCAVSGNYKLAKPLYMVSPFPLIDGCHPALSLEIYSGACIESGKFEEAHKHTDFLLDLRKSIYGENDWRVGGMLGNLAGLYYKEGNFKKAIETYEESIQVCRKAEGDKHLGSAYTRLANSYRAVGNFDKAKLAYQKALAMRTREYGANSLRVAETKLELANLLRLTNQNILADKYKLDALRIIQSQKKNKSGDLISLVAMIAFSFTVSFFLFGKRGLLTGLAIRRIEHKIAQGSQSNQDYQGLLSELKT